MSQELTREEKIALALEYISDGQSVRKACEMAGIAKKVFLEKVDGDQYARARDAQADAHFNEMADLEAECRAGEMDPQTLRAVIDSRKWRLARMRPRLYGDKVTVDNTSSDGSMKPAPSVVLDLTGMTPEEIADLARATFRGE